MLRRDFSPVGGSGEKRKVFDKIRIVSLTLVEKVVEWLYGVTVYLNIQIMEILSAKKLLWRMESSDLYRNTASSPKGDNLWENEKD